MSQEITTRNKDKIVRAINIINDPIRKTLSPRGSNVLLNRPDGTVRVTNDGDTIRHIVRSDDEFEQSIIRLIKDSADRTHQEVGDARSSTIALTSMLSIEALKLLEEGYNHRDIEKNFNLFRDKYVKEIQKLKTPSDKDNLFHVAKISANNDEEVAHNTIEALDVVGEHGLVFFDMNKDGKETIVEKELDLIL